MPINTHGVDEEAITKAIANALEEFYDTLIRKNRRYRYQKNYEAEKSISI